MALYQYIVGQPLLLAVFGVLVLSIYQAAWAVYNLFLNPLRKYPGPKLAAVSQVPCALNIVRGRFPYWAKYLHEYYASDVVRISPRELSFISSSAWKDIHGSRPGRLSLEKDPAVYRKPPNDTASLLTANRVDHARMRRVIGHAFSDKASRDQEPVVESYVNLLIDRLQEQAATTEGKVDISKWFRWTAFDIAGDLSFGESFQCLQNQELHSWAEMIAGFLIADGCLAACNRFQVFQRILPYLLSKKTREMMKDHFAATVEKVSRRIKLGARRPDFISPILKYNEEGKGLTQGEINSNASLFIVAGSDSTATLLTGTIYYLLKNKHTMKRLSSEVRTIFKANDDITVRTVIQSPYVVACLDETARVYPPVQTGQVVIVPPEGDVVGSEAIPGGTGLWINMYAAYRSSRNFRDPDAYTPERWLGDSRFADDDREVFHPFSYGHRSCIGKTLGLSESRLVLARMVWNFDLELCEETDPDWLDQDVFTTWQRKALIVKLHPRRMSRS